MKTSRFRVGDHLVVQRLGYTHHGLYIGSDQVVHYVSSLDGLVNCNNTIGVTSLSEFSQGSRIKIKLHDNPRYSPEEAADRACLRIGEQEYALLSNNCEHFVNWCLEGEDRSEQVNQAKNTATAMSAIAAYQHTQSNPASTAMKSVLAGGGVAGTGLALGALASTATTSATTVGLASFVGSSAGLGSFAGPVGAAVGAGIGLASYGVYKLLKG